jgi:group I intron endonuclease
MSIYSIYKSTNTINGKSYIGFTNNYDRRIRAHKQVSTNPKTYFHKAINKHGWDNFDWNIIYQSTDRDHTLNEMESYFITEYDTFNNGYNSTMGGDAPGMIRHPDAKPNKDYGYILYDPDGNEYETNNIQQFCREHNLKNEYMYRLCNGIIPSYNGWTGYTTSEKQELKKKQRTVNKLSKRQKPLYTWIITDPDGNEYKVKSLDKFAREYMSDYGNFKTTARALLRISNDEDTYSIKYHGWKVLKDHINTNDAINGIINGEYGTDIIVPIQPITPIKTIIREEKQDKYRMKQCPVCGKLIPIRSFYNNHGVLNCRLSPARNKKNKHIVRG